MTFSSTDLLVCHLFVLMAIFLYQKSSFLNCESLRRRLFLLPVFQKWSIIVLLPHAAKKKENKKMSMRLLSLCQPQLAKTSAFLYQDQLLLHLNGTLHGLDNLPPCLFFFSSVLCLLILMVYFKLY